MDTKDRDQAQAVPGFFDGTTNVELKQQALSRFLRHLSRPGGDELEQEKLHVINAALDSLDDLNAGSEHLAEGSRPERSRPRSEEDERAAAACPPWGALLTDELPRRLELLEELKSLPVHELGATGKKPIDKKKVTPCAWAAFLVAPMEGLEEMLENVRAFCIGFWMTVGVSCQG